MSTPRTLFRHTYQGEIPQYIIVGQWAWENDRGNRHVYETSNLMFSNNDDDYGSGWVRVYLSRSNPTQVFPSFRRTNGHGRATKHGIALKVSVIPK